MKINDSVPESLVVGVDLRSERTKRVKGRTLASSRPACKGVEQQANVSRLTVRVARDERPNLRRAEIALECVPLRGDLLRPVGLSRRARRVSAGAP